MFLAVVLMAVCQSTAQPVPSPTPSPSPHTAVADAVLQSSDVTSGLSQCAGSGPLDVYINNLQASSPALASRLTDEWQSLRTLGATSSAIALFTSDDSACTAELAAISKAKSATSLVVMFGDQGQADRAWEARGPGFLPPPPGELPPGLIRGATTG